MIFNIDESSGYMPSWELIGCGLANLRTSKLKKDLTEDEIREVIRWVGICSVDTIFVGGDTPIIRRIGIGLMLSVTLLEFPEYYVKYELAQFN